VNQEEGGGARVRACDHQGAAIGGTEESANFVALAPAARASVQVLALAEAGLPAPESANAVPQQHFRPGAPGHDSDKLGATELVTSVTAGVVSSLALDGGWSWPPCALAHCGASASAPSVSQSATRRIIG
jgi:hypothetical protein